MSNNSNKIAFVAMYRDEGEEWFVVDTAALSSGDHVAQVVARERQKIGELPAGEIVGVRRMTSAAA